MRRGLSGECVGAALAAMLGVSSASARPAPGLDAKGRASAVQALSDCRKVAEDAARLACYDHAAGALDQAEAKGDVVVIDRAQAQQVRRQAFGFSLPSMSLFNRAVKDEAVDRVVVELAAANRNAQGRWMLVTTEDQVWRQTDSEDFYTDPHAGSKLLVKRAALGSYFCKVDGQQAIRCTRDR